MEEALQVIMNLWTAEGPYTHRGRFYAVDEAVCLPRPLQRPHPPVWIGETRGGLLDVCARYGQGWNSVPVGIEEWNRRRESLREACVRIGRNVDEIEYSYETQILIAADRTALRDKVRKMLSLGIDQGDKDWVAFAEGYSDELPASLTDRFLIGTPEEIKTQIQSYVDVGVAHFMLWFMDAPDEDGLALFSKEIIGAFSS